MAKLAISAALFAALIVVATATTTYTTVVTTTIVEEGNPTGQSCQREIQQMMPMRRCMQWMQSMMGPTYEAANPSYQEKYLKDCCGEMWGVSAPCRCEAMKHMMRQMQQHYGTEEEMQQMMKQKMQSLPKMCGMKSPTQCRFQTVFI